MVLTYAVDAAKGPFPPRDMFATAPKLFAGAMLLIAGLLHSSLARSYCRGRTVRPPENFAPAEGKCWPNGKPIYWPNGCLEYRIGENGSKQFPASDVAPLVARAFSLWEETACGTGHPSIHVQQAGLTSATHAEASEAGGAADVNVVVFRDDAWPYSGQSSALALTTVTYGAESGKIYDADIEINTFAKQFVLNPSGVVRGVYDLNTVLLHEAGHFFGLEHSSDQDAIMGGGAFAGRIAADDAAGICAIYPPDGTRITPRGPEPAEACMAAKGGCAVGPTSGDLTLPLATLGVLAIVATAGARRKREARPPAIRAS